MVKTCRNGNADLSLLTGKLNDMLEEQSNFIQQRLALPADKKDALELLDISQNDRSMIDQGRFFWLVNGCG